MLKMSSKDGEEHALYNNPGFWVIEQLFIKFALLIIIS